MSKVSTKSNKIRENAESKGLIIQSFKDGSGTDYLKTEGILSRFHDYVRLYQENSFSLGMRTMHLEKLWDMFVEHDMEFIKWLETTYPEQYASQFTFKKTFGLVMNYFNDGNGVTDMLTFKKVINNKNLYKKVEDFYKKVGPRELNTMSKVSDKEFSVYLLKSYLKSNVTISNRVLYHIQKNYDYQTLPHYIEHGENFVDWTTIIRQEREFSRSSRFGSKQRRLDIDKVFLPPRINNSVSKLRDMLDIFEIEQNENSVYLDSIKIATLRSENIEADDFGSQAKKIVAQINTVIGDIINNIKRSS